MSSSVPDQLVDAIAIARGAPDDGSVWDAVDELARSTQRPEEVSKLYRDVLAQKLRPELLGRIGERAAQFHEEWFEDPKYVVEILQRVLTVDAGAEWAFERLSLLLTMAERWDDLLAEYDRALEATTEPKKQEQLLDEAARIAKDFAGQTNRAIEYLKQLVPLRPADAQLAQSLERRLVLQKRYDDLIQIWNARLNVLDSSDARTTRVRIAETWLDKLSNAGNALTVARELLGAEDAEAQACRLLERIGTRETAPIETRREALNDLRARHEAAGRGEEIVRTIELALAVAAGDEELGALHREARDRLADLGRPSDAVEHGAALLIVAPETDVCDRLRELVVETGRFDRFVESLVAAADATNDATQRVAFTVEAGQICQDSLEDANRAIELYTKVLVDGAAAEAFQLDVCRRLTQLLVGSEHSRQRLEVLERLSSLEPEGTERRSVLGDAARLAEHLADEAHALALWQRRLSMDPSDMEALDASVDILERTEDWEGMVGMLRRRADARQADAKRADLVRIASVYQQDLGDTEQAIDVWREIQDEFGSNAETIDALANLSAAARRWTDVVGLLRAAADGESDVERRADRLTKMGDVYREQRGAPGNAVESYREALQIDAMHAGARHGLEQLLENTEAAGSAVETLAAAYARAGQWQGTLELMERRLALALDPEFKKTVLLEAAGLREQQAGDAEGALDCTRRAFAVVWSKAIEADLVRLAESTGAWEVAARGYQEAVQACDDPRRERELLFQQGQVLESRLGQLEQALTAYLGITDTEPGNLEAACAVIRVGGRTAHWDAVARVMVDAARARNRFEPDIVASFESAVAEANAWDSAVRAAEEAAARGDTLEPNIAHDLERQLAVWHRDRREDFERAEGALERAVSYRPEADTLRMLAELQRCAPGARLVDTLLKLADVTEDDLDVLHEAGKVALHATRDVALTQSILQRTLKVASARWQSSGASADAEPTDAERYTLWSLERLVALRLADDAALAALELLVEAAELPSAPEKARQLRFQAAEIASEKLDDVPRAVELCQGILDESPDHAPAIALLAGLYSREGRLEDLLALRRRELELEPEPPVDRRLELRLDISRVVGEIGGDSRERVSALRDNLGDEPGHEPSVAALAEVLSREEHHAELYDVLVEQAVRVQELGRVHQAAALWARAGELAEQPLGDVRRALDAYRRSVDLDPSLAVLDALARIHTARDEHASAVHWLGQRLAATGRGPDDLAAYRDTVLRLARAQRAADQEDDSRATLTAALEQDPAAGKLREFLAEIYRDSEDWQLLAPVLAEGVDYAPDDSAKIQLLIQAAQVHRRRLGQIEQAVPLLQRAVELAPQDRAVRLALADALRVAERFDAARALLEALLEEFGRRRTRERAAVHYHLARIARAQHDLSEAMQQLEAASSIERADPKILRLLGDVAREKGEPDQAERAYRALLLIVRRSAPKAPAEDSDDEVITASEVMYDLYRMALEQGQTDRANDLMESAFETAAENNTEALHFERVLRAAGQSDLVLRVLEARLGRISDPDAAAEILVARAELFASTGRLDDALESLLEALGRTPGSLPLLKSAQELAVRSGSLDKYVERLADVAESKRSDRKASGSLWLRLGRLSEKELHDVQRASRFYEKALEVGYQAFTSFQALKRLLPEDAVEARRRALQNFAAAPEEEGADAGVRTKALYDLAEFELAQPGNVDAGVQHLADAIDREPELALAEQLLRTTLQHSPSHEGAARLYERVARQLGDPGILLEALTFSAALSDASLDLIRDGCELARERGDEEKLTAFLERLVSVALASENLSEVTWAVTDLANRREASGNVQGAVELLQQAAAVTEGAEAFELDLWRATLAAGPLGNPALAVEVYERLLEAEPAEPRVWKPLLDAYRALGQSEKLEACIARTVDAVYDPVERNLLRMERGRILLADPGRQDEAETMLREVLDEDPDHVQACVVLADLLEQAGRYEELRDLLQRQLEGARDRNDGEAVATIALRVGANLTDRSEALTLYRESLDAAPGNRALLEALLRLYGPEDDPNDRVAAMEQLLSIEQGPAAGTLALELSDLLRSMGQEERALEALRTGFSSCPTHDALREQLLSTLRAREDHRGLAEALIRDAEHRAHASEAVAQYRQAAALYTDQLADTARAAEVLGAALKQAPQDAELLTDFVNYHVEDGDAAAAMPALTEAIEAEGGAPADRARLLAMRAKLRTRAESLTLAVLAEAISDLEEAAGLVEGGFEQDRADLLEAQRLQAAEEGDPSIERTATMALSHLLPKLGEHRRGLELLVGWVKQNPEDADAVRGLGQFAADAEKWGAAAKAYQRLLDITVGPERIDAAVCLAEACEKAGSPLDARPALEQVYAEAPDDEMIRGRLRRMYEAAEAYEQLAAIMIAEADQAMDDAVRYERLIEAGDLSLRVSGGERTAISAFNRALAIRPGDHAVTIRLGDTLAAVGEIEEAATLLDTAINTHHKRRSPELSELQHCMARIGRTAEDYEAVFAWLEAAVLSDRQNGAAAAELARLAMEQGQVEVAIKALQAITLLKVPGPMSRAEAYLRQGMIAEQKGDRKKALFLAKRALTTEPDYSEAQTFLAQLGE